MTPIRLTLVGHIDSGGQLTATVTGQIIEDTTTTTEERAAQAAAFNHLDAPDAHISPTGRDVEVVHRPQPRIPAEVRAALVEVVPEALLGRDVSLPMPGDRLYLWGIAAER